MRVEDEAAVKPGPESGAALLIIVAILALIAALSIGTRYYGGSTRQLAQRTDTQQDNVHFEDAIAAFMVQNSRLPCPSNILVNPGQEDCGTVPYSSQVLPWFTLGLTESQARDKWGNYYSYHVLDKMLETDATKNYFDADGALTIEGLNIYETHSSATAISEKALFVVISHGPNGYSAYTSSKAKKADSTDIDELDNETSYADAASSHYVKTGTSGGKFDDLLTYWLATRP